MSAAENHARYMQVKVLTDNQLMGHACNCIGPQGGQPLCPCRMRGVEIENGRYVERRDLGPVGK